jgi:hypothetical protein
LEDVHDFTYLGSKVNRTGGISEDISSGLQKARSSFIALKQIWRSSIYSNNTKLRIYRGNAMPVLLYSSECWKTTKYDIKKCESFHNRCLRRILRIFWPNNISNEKLRQRTKSRTIEDERKIRRWRYIGHILMRDNSNNRKIALTWAPEGKRKRGRPNETWGRTTERERSDMGWTSWREAELAGRDWPK